MTLLIQINLNRGFVDYVNQSYRDRLDELAVTLGEHYEQSGSWQSIQDPATWVRLTGGPPGGRDKRPPPPLRAPPPRQQRPQKGDKKPPRGGPLGFGPRVALLDASDRRLIGRPLPPGADVYRSPVMVNDTLVGTLTIFLPKKLSGNRDLNFLEQQYRGLAIIGLAMLALATGLAWWLALNLTRPLMQTISAVRQLAEGHYGERLASGRRDEVGSLARDIDLLSQKLHENQRSRQRWISDISHELRTPLAIVRGELEAIRDGVRKPTAAAIDSLHAEAIRLGQLIDDLHQLAVADRGALNYSMKPVDLGDIVRQVCSSFKARISKAELQLTHSFEDDVNPTVMGDARRLTQLLGNLLENSLRYTDAGGTIEVRVSQSDGNAIVQVQDSAPGVPEAECQRLFERLYRVESSRSRASGGSGLGLSICESIAKAHDGSISAMPAKTGGLAITLTLPLTSQ